jgi:mannose-6-phosphate isomerase-like protein (cupin superfamily)
MLTTLFLAGISAAILSSALCEVPTNPALNRQLRNTLTRVEFVNALTGDDTVYDFSKAVADPLPPGSVLNANAATFPMIQGSGMTVAQINLGPCAMLSPHVHPRANNMVVAVSGQTKTFMRTENGANDIITTLTPGKATMFFSGSVHNMYNEGKSPLSNPHREHWQHELTASKQAVATTCSTRS